MRGGRLQGPEACELANALCGHFLTRPPACATLLYRPAPLGRTSATRCDKPFK